MLKSEQPRDPDERKRFNEQQLAAREAMREVGRLEATAITLAQAIRAMRLASLDATGVEEELRRVQNRLAAATATHPGRILPRARPNEQRRWCDGERGKYTLFVDESGGTRYNLTPSSPYFAIGGLLVSDAAYADLERRWQDWKLTWVGRPNATMHAKQLTRKAIRYYARLGGAPDDALKTLEELLATFDCTLFVTAIDKRAFLRDYGDSPISKLMPSFHYGLALTFLLERSVWCLLEREDSYAEVIAESRSRLEDAAVQVEYQRLQIEGPPFQASSWFRYQLGPHITFQRKDDNVAGLQVIDILLKAVVHRLGGEESALRWGAARNKLYDGGKGRIRGYGLKVFPDDHAHVDAILADNKNEGRSEEDPSPAEQSGPASKGSMSSRAMNCQDLS